MSMSFEEIKEFLVMEYERLGLVSKAYCKQVSELIYFKIQIDVGFGMNTNLDLELNSIEQDVNNSYEGETYFEYLSSYEPLEYMMNDSSDFNLFYSKN